MKAIMISGPNSNSGKTTMTLGILRALKNREIDVRGFKTGPDFIDRELLSLASKNPAGNLDIHMMGEEGVRESIAMNLGEIAIIEGAMGYFDGIYNTFINSSFDISRKLNIPAVLVYTPKGEMFSAIPKIKGMVEFKDSKIKAIILNKVSYSMYLLLKEKIEEHINIKVLGYLPKDETLRLETQSLGLSIDGDSKTLGSFLENAACKIEETIDMDALLDLANDLKEENFVYPKKKNIKIAIGRDSAFNFYYMENLKLLENTCRVEYFSPLKDKVIPEADLIYISGGGIENFREDLSRNKSMMASIKEFSLKGGYILAESAGLIYLQACLEETEMIGIFQGQAKLTHKLKRFGYVDIEILEDCILGKKGEKFTGQEFHKSFIETEEEEIFSIRKPMSTRKWKCGYKVNNTLGYFQHINFLGNKLAFNNLLDILEENGSDKNVY